MDKIAKKDKKSLHFNAIRAAFPHTLPIMAGFLFLGMSYGILMSSRGFSFLFPMCTSLFVFAGSLEFALANVLIGAFDPLEALFLALVINARHIFYGISMLDRYKGLGKKKIYMIFALCDETFSVNYSAECPRGVDEGWFRFYISLLDQSYWVLGATLGGVFGSLIPNNIAGIDFAMTAMFVVILLEQMLGGLKNLPSVIVGVGFSLLSLLIFGSSDFIIPAMLMIFLSLTLLRSPIERFHNIKEGDVS